MSFIKDFKFTKEKGLILLNTIERDAFLKEKIQHFSNYQNYMSKIEILNLLQEILDMCDYDMETATFDNSEISGIIGFNPTEHSNKMILYYNSVVMLGTIYLNTFNLIGNRLIGVEDGTNGPISTSSMLSNGYNELLSKKQLMHTDSINAYGATLIFATLIEKELKSKIKRTYLNEYITTLQTKINNEEIILEHDELNLLIFLQSQYLKDKVPDFIFDSVYATTTACYSLLTKYEIIDRNDNDLRKLILNQITLNPFLSSNLFKNKADYRFVKMANILFNTDKLNLRNNLAHCNFGYLNYYNISATALLYGVLMMILKDLYLS